MAKPQDSENQSLLVKAKTQTPSFSELTRLFDTNVAAFEKDLLNNFLYHAPGYMNFRRHSPTFRKIIRWTTLLLTYKGRHRKWFFLVNGGYGAAIATPPAKPRTLLGFLGDLFYNVTNFMFLPFLLSLQIFQSREQRRRFAKFAQCDKELRKELESKTGKKANEMVYVDLLAVSPSFQGAGYGRIIMDTIKEKANQEGKDVYLFCHQLNVSYYERRGYTVVCSQTLRDAGPDSEEQPLVLYAMISYAPACA